MEKLERNRMLAIIKYRNQQYLNSIENADYHSRFERKIAKLACKTQSLLRKKYGSENSIDELSYLGKLIAGFIEDIKRVKAPQFDFLEYKNVINSYLINYLDIKRQSNYDGQCASYGETLFVLYLDLFITATIRDSVRKLQVNPPFLINPKTGSFLEIDVLFEDFKLAFEFQGEHHYTNSNTQEKDLFKLSECRTKGIILIPVNISQLNTTLLQALIINSIKDFLGIHQLFTSEREVFKFNRTSRPTGLLNFCKLTERLYTSTVVFDACAGWLDNLSTRYIGNMQSRSPISSSTVAPRQMPPSEDFDIERLYKGLKHVTAFRKSLPKPMK